MSNPVLVGVNDLFFSAKITGPANVLGVPMKCFPSCDRLLAAAREAGSPPPLVILDLESVGGDPVSLIRAVKSDEGLKDARVVAFGRHTNAETLQAADDAGADHVMPRSDFVQVLPDLLRACADGARTAPRAQTGTESSP
jgi:DNA-binding NarL/FixJ family response regulator